ncbi:hypothetical protein Ahia01_000443100, partial [Argonauta hians]
ANQLVVHFSSIFTATVRKIMLGFYQTNHRLRFYGIHASPSSLPSPPPPPPPSSSPSSSSPSSTSPTSSSSPLSSSSSSSPSPLHLELLLQKATPSFEKRGLTLV